MSEHEFRWHPAEVREALASGERHPTASCSGEDWFLYTPLLDNEAGRATAFAQHAQHLAILVSQGTKVATEPVLVQAVRDLAEEWTQRAYSTLSIEHGLTIQPVPGHLDRALVPAHWRDAAEDRATVPVKDLLALLEGR